MTEKNRQTLDFVGVNPSRFSDSWPENGPKQPEITYEEAVKRIEGYQDEWFQELMKWEDRFYSAKVFFGCFPALVSAWIYFDYGLTIAAGLSLILYALVLIAYNQAKKWMKGKEFECYSNIKENIYVYSQRRNDQEVYERQVFFEKKIYESANESYPMVISIYFADHENANEQWDVEWPNRLLNTVLENRAERHRKLGSSDPAWYKKHILKQKGVK